MCYSARVAVDFDIDPDRVRAFLRGKAAARRAQIDERFERATLDAQAIVAEIARVVKPRRIYQWGSLLSRDRFTEISDIDIALEGLAGAEQFFAALGLAMERSTLPIDVVELEKLPPTTAERIRERGKLVYERDEPADP